MDITITRGCIYAIFTVIAFAWQYSMIINDWIYTELHRLVYWPLVCLLIPPAVVICQMAIYDKPFLVAIEHQIEQFCLYALALSGAWMIGRYKLVRDGKWDVRISYDEELEQFFGRTYADSPDIDGRVWIASDEPIREGDFVMVKIDGCIDGDLSGYVIEE